MRRKDEINAMMESKFDEIKNAFIGETKEILISSIKEETKTNFTEGAGKIQRSEHENGCTYNVTKAFQ